jgi:hypothetical protein
MLLVGGVLAMPGFLAGGLAALLLGSFFVCAMVGMILGACLGAAMEAWPHKDGEDHSATPVDR